MRRHSRITILSVLLLSLFATIVVLYVSSYSKSFYNIPPKIKLAQKLELNKNYKIEGLNFQSNSGQQVKTTNKVSEQLAILFPFDENLPIPKILWQTWKVGLEDESFPEKYKIYHQTWTEKSPEYEYNVLSDKKCAQLVNELYKDIPDVIKAYHAMPKIILKVDFFRYLILFAKGGTYSDMDTVSLKPFKDWPSSQSEYLGEPINPGLVVGIEADPDREDWADWYARRVQFCQWTILSKKGHPMLRELIAKITTITLARELAGQLNEVFDKTNNKNDVLNWTGPGIFTDLVFRYLNLMLQSKEVKDNDRIEEVVGIEFFTHMEQPIVIENIMILPITCFSPSDTKMGAKGPNDPLSLLDHGFDSSWKEP
ncbi:hypothetical protein KGF54_003503 [Candida jiufengensis]|uniref:uncharacterized protein n=1 Tax=Candida jiufengensis TaxID=497108 RepID=UPI002224D5C1|nr:uncharacterized protein KGF54_003503 [Candida jiufengensis]KAI5952636.1 hypothetical protein KGF54_003503 [Candida jiufengensis]